MVGSYWRKGCVENEELLALAQARAEAEESYGLRLQELSKNVLRKGGFTRDDGASVRKAFDGMRKEMEEVRTHHKLTLIWVGWQKSRKSSSEFGDHGN